jgi:hypothetical protein
MSDNHTNQASYPEPSIGNYDLTSMASGQFEQLNALFKLIDSYAVTNTPLKHNDIKLVATTGQYLCQSWGGVYEWELECIEHHQDNSDKPTNAEHSGDEISKSTPDINGGGAKVNIKALQTALYELHELNSFVADMSRILQQDEVMNNETIVTRDFKAQAGATIETAARKELELYDIIQAAIGIDINIANSKPRHKLLDMPSEISYYYGQHGVLKDEG